MASAAARARRTFFMRTSIERLHKDGRAPRRNQLTDWKECAVLPRCNLPPFCGRAYLFRSDGYRGNQEGHFRYPGVSNAITIIVDLRSEHDLKVLLKAGH